MKAFSSTLCSLVTALAVSFSSSAKAEDFLDLSLKPKVEITSTSSTTKSSRTTPDFLPKLNEPKLRFKLLNPNYSHRAGTTSSSRLELPNSIIYNIPEKEFELIDQNKDVKCYYRPKGKFFSCEYHNKNNEIKNIDVVSSIKPILKNNFFDNITIRGIKINRFYDEFNSQFSKVAIKGSIIAENLWNDVYEVIKPHEIEAALTFADFFRQNLPQFTKDGVVTISEGNQIKDSVIERLEEYYHIKLNESEQKAIDQAINRFMNDFNDTGNNYQLIRDLRFINSTPGSIFEKIKYNEISLKSWFEMFSYFKPLYTLEYDDNSFNLKSDFYSRFKFDSDWFNQFKNNQGLFQHGSLSASHGEAEGHLRLSGEIHAGKPLREFFDEKYSKNIDKIEFLLGWQPVIIDGSLNGIVGERVFFETKQLYGYESIIKKWGQEIGLGITRGFVYRLNSLGEASLKTSANSFEDRIKGEFQGLFLIEERLGQQNDIYLFSQNDSITSWYSTIHGITLENLHVLEKIWTANFKFVYDYSGKGFYGYSWSKNENFQLLLRSESRNSLRAGLHLDILDPYFFVNSSQAGGGILFKTSLLTVEAETGSKGYLNLNSLIALQNNLDTKKIQDLHVKKQQLRDSFFPAKKAVINDLEREFYSSLDGGYLEISFSEKSEKNFPHDVPRSLSLEIILGNLGSKKEGIFSRLGYKGTFSERMNGLYFSLGGKNFLLDLGFGKEEIPGRHTFDESKSYANYGNTDLQISFNNLQLTFSGYLFPPAFSYYMFPEQDSLYGDIGVNLHLEGSTEDLFKGLANIYRCMNNLSKINFSSKK